jgi:hypothetical protein
VENGIEQTYLSQYIVSLPDKTVAILIIHRSALQVNPLFFSFQCLGKAVIICINNNAHQEIGWDLCIKYQDKKNIKQAQVWRTIAELFHYRALKFCWKGRTL